MQLAPVHPEIVTELAYVPPNSAWTNGVNLSCRGRRSADRRYMYRRSRWNPPFGFRRAEKRQPAVVVAAKIRHQPEIPVEVVGDGGASAMQVAHAVVGRRGIARQKEYPKNHSTLGVSACSAGTITKATAIVAINRTANLIVASRIVPAYHEAGNNPASLSSNQPPVLGSQLTVTLWSGYVDHCVHHGHRRIE